MEGQSTLNRREVSVGEDLCQAGGPNGAFACFIPPKTAKNLPYRCNCFIVSILGLAGFRLWALDFPCMEGVWCRDGYYPEDATPKCSFLTTCLPWLFARTTSAPLKSSFGPTELLQRGLIPPRPATKPRNQAQAVVNRGGSSPLKARGA